jgi:hypothetical protein
MIGRADFILRANADYIEDQIEDMVLNKLF